MDILETITSLKRSYATVLHKAKYCDREELEGYLDVAVGIQLLIDELERTETERPDVTGRFSLSTKAAA